MFRSTFAKLFLLTFMLLGAHTLTATGLPRTVQIDMINVEIAQKVKAKDHKGSLVAIGKLESLGEKLRGTPLFLKGQALVFTNEPTAAKVALERYLSEEGRKGACYQDALQLLVKANAMVEEGRVAEAAHRLEAKRQKLAAEAETLRAAAAKRKAKRKRKAKALRTAAAKREAELKAIRKLNAEISAQTKTLFKLRTKRIQKQSEDLRKYTTSAKGYLKSIKKWKLQFEKIVVNAKVEQFSSEAFVKAHDKAFEKFNSEVNPFNYHWSLAGIDGIRELKERVNEFKQLRKAYKRIYDRCKRLRKGAYLHRINISFYCGRRRLSKVMVSTKQKKDIPAVFNNTWYTRRNYYVVVRAPLGKIMLKLSYKKNGRRMGPYYQEEVVGGSFSHDLSNPLRDHKQGISF